MDTNIGNESDNKIGDEGARSLCDSFATLTELNLERNIANEIL